MGKTSSIILNTVLLTALLLVLLVFVIYPSRTNQNSNQEGQVSGQSTD